MNSALRCNALTTLSSSNPSEISPRKVAIVRHLRQWRQLGVLLVAIAALSSASAGFGQPGPAYHMTTSISWSQPALLPFSSMTQVTLSALGTGVQTPCSSQPSCTVFVNVSYAIVSGQGVISASPAGVSTLTIYGLGPVTVKAYINSSVFRMSSLSGSSQNMTFTVNPPGLIAQTINFQPIAPQTFGATPPSLQAQATSGQPVMFSSDTRSVCTVTTAGVLTFVSGGTCTIVAYQPGIRFSENVAFDAALTKRTFNIAPIAQTISFPQPASVTYASGQTISLAAIASSNLPVSYTVTSGPATVSGSTLTISASGTVALTATQAGNASYLAAAPVSQSITVNPISQTISFPQTTFTYNPGPGMYIIPVATSGLPVHLAVTSGSATLNTVPLTITNPNNPTSPQTIPAGSALAISGSGGVAVTASQPGNQYYAAAPSLSQYIYVYPPPTWPLNGPIGSFTVPAQGGLQTQVLEMAVDTHGSLYFATDSTSTSTIFKEVPSGGAYIQYPVGTGLTPGGVAVDASGNVYITTLGNNQVVKETPRPDGGYDQSVIVTGVDAASLIAVDNNGNLYLVDCTYAPNTTHCSNSAANVVKETFAGGSYTQSPILTNIQADFTGIAVDGSGNVYITTYNGAPGVSTTLIVETPAGGTNYTPTTITGAPAGSTGVAVDGSGNIYLSNLYPAQVTVEEPSSTAASGYTSAVLTTSGLVSPRAIAVDANGTAYVFNYQGQSSASAISVFHAASQTINFTAPATVTYGSPIQLSATVTTTGGGSGNPVVFSVASGPGWVSGTNGSTLNITGVGTVKVTATLAGKSPLYAPATSQTQTITVTPASQTIHFTAPAAPVTYGAPIQLTAGGGGSGSPVVFSVASGPGWVSGANGSTLNITGVGAIVINATQAADANNNYLPATMPPQTINVGQSTPTFGQMGFTPASEPFGISQQVTLSDTLSYAGIAPPAGAVKYTLNGAPSYTATCSSTGSNQQTCAYTVPAAVIAALPVTAAGYSVTVASTADNNYTAATGSPATFAVSKSTPAFGSMILTPGSDSLGVGQQLTIIDTLNYTGSVAPADAVTYTLNGISYPPSSSPNICSNNSSSKQLTCTYTVPAAVVAALPITAAGYSVTAAYAADNNYTAAQGTPATFSIGKSTPAFGTMSLSSASEPYHANQSVTITDTLTYTSTGNTSPTVNTTPNAITYTLTDHYANYSTTWSYTASCTSGSNNTLNCTATIPAGDIQAMPATQYTVARTYAGDSNYAAANGSGGTFNITQIAPTFGAVSFSPAATEPYSTNQSVTISDTLNYVGSTSPIASTSFLNTAVAYGLNNSSYLASCSNSSSTQLTCTAAVPAAVIAALPVTANGYPVTASFSTSSAIYGNYAATAGSSGTLSITSLPQVINFPSPGPQTYLTAPASGPTLTATGGASTQPVTFVSTAPSVCTITTAGALTFVGAGNCAITASQAAPANNSNYLAATSVSQTFVVTHSLPPMGPTAPTAAVGAAGQMQTALITFASAITLNANLSTAIQFFTQGNASLDFHYAPGGSCTSSATYAAGSSCTVNYTFTPQAPGLRMGAIFMPDTSNYLRGPYYLGGKGTGPLVGFSGGAQTSIYTFPSGSIQNLAVDAYRNVYSLNTLYSDGWWTSTVTKFSWNGTSYSPPSTMYSQLGGSNAYTGLAVDGVGNVFSVMAPWLNQSLDLEVGGILELPWGGGAGASLPTAWLGDLNVALDAAGNLYVGECGVYGCLNSPSSSNPTPPTAAQGQVVMYTMGANSQYTLGPTIASGFQPGKIMVDGLGNVFIADTSNNRIVKVSLSNGIYGSPVTVVASVVSPAVFAMDGNNNLYFNVAGGIAKLPWNGSSYGAQSLVVAAQSTSDIAVDGQGNLFYIMSGQTLVPGGYAVPTYTLQEVDVSDPPSLSFTSSSPNPATVTVWNNGNTNLTFSAPASISSNSFTLNSGACPGPLAAGGSCVLSVTFNSAVTGTFSGSMVMTDNTLNSTSQTQTIPLTGTAP
jgi:hypothetical protein